MTLSESFLSNAAWLFFAAWTAMIAAITVAAFGRDLLPWAADLNPAPKSRPTDRARPTRPTAC